MSEDERKPLLSIQSDGDDREELPTISSGYSSIPKSSSQNGILNSRSGSSLSSLPRNASYGEGSSPGQSPSPRKLSKASINDVPQKTRKPFHYSPSVTSLNRAQTIEDQNAAATYNRHRYYSKLTPPDDTTLRIPDHMIPTSFFLLLPIRKTEGKQSSIITIFSIWNTMMGTSLLSMPWAVGEAGLVLGIIILITMAGLTLYTCYRVVKSVDNFHKPGEILEFSDVCRHYLGKWGEYCSVFFSLSALLGAMIVYWVLLSNFLFHTVKYIYEDVNHINMSAAINVTKGAICPHPRHPPIDPTVHTNNSLPVITSFMSQSLVVMVNNSNGTIHNTTDGNEALFNKVWQQTLTVPFFLVLILGPLLNFKSPTFFTKFNALGTVCVAYIIAFVSIKASQWGINVDFTPNTRLYVPIAREYFPAFTGMLALAYFIHNGVVSILRGQKHPENNGRDLSIAYVLVALTYTFVGVVFYISFPLTKDCIESNLLDNFPSGDILAFVARICLLFQMITVFPLLIYIFRLQLMHTLFGAVYPGLLHVLVLNLLVLALCVIFAIFLPKIGTIIRFSGAFCGLAYIFTLPCLVYLLYLRQQGRLRWPTLVLHSTIIVLGCANFFGQFAIINSE
ncbi:neutral amino acid transporter 9-like isoform X2 [Ptychodera flava]|uniref:neutral amino acid transporter 9-like isoform X2 n=1 Tax=Ptychodera flava TaxID=63121 RepID=UPI003969BD46